MWKRFLLKNITKSIGFGKKGFHIQKTILRY